MSQQETAVHETADARLNDRVPDVRRERRLMRAFQSRLLGPVIRRVGGPEHLLEKGMAYWSSRLICAAVESGVFTELAGGPMSEHDLASRLGWHPRAAGTALSALVELGLLRRDKSGCYANTSRSAMFLDRGKSSYLGGFLELSGTRMYGLWGGLGGLLHTGRPAAEEEQGENEFFSSLYRDPVALRNFLAGMTGVSTGEATLIAARFPWKRFRTFADIGSAQGALPVRVALTHPHLRGAGFDLPAVEPIFSDYLSSFGLADRLHFIAGDFLHQPLPNADVVSFGHVFHGLPRSTRLELAAKAYTAVPPGGAMIVYDAMVQPRRPYTYFSLLSSLNIMLESRDGFESSTAECGDFLRSAGFDRIKARHLLGPTSMVYGFKPGRLV
ncbi:MAG: hypothetical protein QOE41_1632 [Mycobacterium sp.]|jgi:hypothetical protein|nr:Methyltransferase [Mycobacterium sp.]MDT5132321.1 hypothetical protein [Mycobacterium sp.]